jgi:WD40 repeat protein
LIQKWNNPKGRTPRVLITNDGKYAVSSACDCNYVWDVGSGKIIFEIEDHEGEVEVALSGDGKQLVTGHGHKVIIWDLATSKKKHTIAIEGASVACLALGGDILAVGTDDLAVALYDRTSFKKMHTFEPSKEFGESGELRFLRFDDQGTRLVLGLNQAHPLKRGGREVLRVMDVNRKQEVSTIEDSPDEHSQWMRASLGAMAISRDGEFVAAVGCHGHLKVWEASNGKLVGEYGKREGKPSGSTPIRYFDATFCPDDKHVAVSDMFGCVLVFNTKSKKVENTLDHKLIDERIHGFMRLGSSANGRFVVTACREVIFVWDLSPATK